MNCLFFWERGYFILINIGWNGLKFFWEFWIFRIGNRGCGDYGIFGKYGNRGWGDYGIFGKYGNGGVIIEYIEYMEIREF